MTECSFSNSFAQILRRDGSQEDARAYDTIGNALFIGADRLVALQPPPAQLTNATTHLAPFSVNTHRQLDHAITALDSSSSNDYLFITIDAKLIVSENNAKEEKEKATTSRACFLVEPVDTHSQSVHEVAEVTLPSPSSSSSFIERLSHADVLGQFRLVDAATSAYCSSNVSGISSSSSNAPSCIVWTKATRERQKSVEQHMLDAKEKEETAETSDERLAYLVYERSSGGNGSLVLRGAFLPRRANRTIAFLQF